MSTAETALPGTRVAAPSKGSIFQLPVPILLYFLAILIPVHFYLGPLYLTTVRLLLLTLSVPLVINLLRGQYGRILLTDVLFILFLFWMGCALAINNPGMLVGQMGSVGVEFLCGYLLGRAYIRDEKSFINMVIGLLVIITFSLPFAMYETLTGNPIIIELIRKLPGLTSEPIVSIERRWGLERVQVMLAHPIHYGLLCSTALSLTFVGLKGSMSLGKRVLASLIIFACVFFSLSSGALLAALLQVFFILWAALFHKNKHKWLILLGIMLLVYIAIDLLSNRTPIRVFMHYATFSSHNAYWRGIIFEWGMKNVWGNPIFGIGLNDWERPWYMYSGSMDNFWLVMTVRYGIPAFLLLTAGYLIALFKVGLHPLEQGSRIWQLRRGWMFTFVGLTLTLITVHIWTTIYSYVFFLLGAGLWMFCNPQAITEETNTSDPGSLRASGSKRKGTVYSRFPHKNTAPNSVP